MPERDGYIPGVPCWIDTSEPDVQAGVDFYRALFGWELQDAMPPGSDTHYFIARIRGGDVAAVASQPEGQAQPARWNTYVWVDSADDAAARVRDAGGSVLAEPMDVPEAGRMAIFADPEGCEFRVWQAGRHRGARIVNEHGSLNFNTLASADPERAKAFYGAVFGWTTLELPGGATMWTLPGYGDSLEAATPGLRKNMAEMGAPAGFEDVVASLLPADAQQPPGWGVTFAVEDADEIARRAAELGGSVLVAPFDAPWVRMTVLSDPAGATFTASKFVPENRSMETATGEPAAAA